jgi:hypothetical protein
MKPSRAPERTVLLACCEQNVTTLYGPFTAGPLVDRIEGRRAYVLVSLAHPHVTAKQWDSFIKRHAAASLARGGLFTIRDERRYVHSVFRYKVDESPLFADGRALRLHDLVMAQLPCQTLVPAFVACVERLASHLGCGTVALDVPAPSGGFHGATLLPALQAAGFWMGGATMVRQVRP